MRESFRRWRLVAKLLTVILGVAGIGMGILGWRQTSQEVAAIESHSRGLAQQAVRFTVAGIEHTMLEGKGVAVKELLRRYRLHVPDAKIDIYDNLGYEVFGEKPPPPAPSTLPPELVEILDRGGRVVSSNGNVYRAITDEERCRACHKEATPLRGVLEHRPNPTVLTVQRKSTIPTLLRNAFLHVMTSDHAHMLDDFFTHVQRQAPTVRAIAVYGNDAQLRFGTEIESVTADDVRSALAPGAAPRTLPREASSVVLLPLPKQERCGLCHDDPNPVRGVLAVSLADIDGAPAAIEEIESVIDSSIRVIMMSSLGRMIIGYLRGVAETGALTDIVLYDQAGRSYFSAAPAAPPQNVREMLAAPTDENVRDVKVGEPRVVVTRLLKNEGKCITCHGTDSKVRGVVSMSLSRRATDEVQKAAVRTTTSYIALTLAGMLLVLTPLIIMIVGGPRRRRGQRDATST